MPRHPETPPGDYGGAGVEGWVGLLADRDLNFGHLLRCEPVCFSNALGDNRGSELAFAVEAKGALQRRTVNAVRDVVGCDVTFHFIYGFVFTVGVLPSHPKTPPGDYGRVGLGLLAFMLRLALPWQGYGQRPFALPRRPSQQACGRS